MDIGQNISDKKETVKRRLTERFYEWLPAKPYCTDLLGGLTIRPKSVAAQKAYIQYNPIHRAYWLCFDLDYPQRRYWYEESAVPVPNIEVRNRRNEHSHIFYLLDPAVFTLRNARRKPLELAADVDRGLTEVLKADPGYGKLIGKNPLCEERWEVLVWQSKAWCLYELVEWIPRGILKRQPGPREVTGLGRNCTVFEKSRHYAYSRWRGQGFENYGLLFENVYKMAMDCNSGFISPMQEREVRCIVRSICKWTAKNHSAGAFSKIQKSRNLKSQLVRHKQSMSAAERVVAYKVEHPKATIREIAGVFRLSVGSVHKYLNPK
jgi:hypothetical protein